MAHPAIINSSTLYLTHHRQITCWGDKGAVSTLYICAILNGDFLKLNEL